MTSLPGAGVAGRSPTSQVSVFGAAAYTQFAGFATTVMPVGNVSTTSTSREMDGPLLRTTTVYVASSPATTAAGFTVLPTISRSASVPTTTVAVDGPGEPLAVGGVALWTCAEFDSDAAVTPASMETV